MDWQLILSIVIPLGAFMGWVYGRLDRKFDGITQEVKEMKTALTTLDSRLAKIEGKLEEREFQEWKQKKIG